MRLFNSINFFKPLLVIHWSQKNNWSYRDYCDGNESKKTSTSERIDKCNSTASVLITTNLNESLSAEAIHLANKNEPYKFLSSTVFPFYAPECIKNVLSLGRLRHPWATRHSNGPYCVNFTMHRKPKVAGCMKEALSTVSASSRVLMEDQTSGRAPIIRYELKVNDKSEKSPRKFREVMGH